MDDEDGWSLDDSASAISVRTGLGRVSWPLVLGGIALTVVVLAVVLFVIAGSSAGAGGDCGGG